MIYIFLKKRWSLRTKAISVFGRNPYLLVSKVINAEPHPVYFFKNSSIIVLNFFDGTEYDI